MKYTWFQKFALMQKLNWK